MPGGVSGSWPWSMPTVSGTPPLLPTRRRTLLSSTGTCTSGHCMSSNPRTSRSARGSWTATPCLTTGSPSTRSKWPWVWGGKKYYSIPPSSARGRLWTGSCFCWGKGHCLGLYTEQVKISMVFFEANGPILIIGCDTLYMYVDNTNGQLFIHV